MGWIEYCQLSAWEEDHVDLAPQGVEPDFPTYEQKSGHKDGVLETQMWAGWVARRNPDTTGPLTLQPQHLEGVVLWLLGACPSDWLLLWGRGRKRERVVESLFQHLTGRTGGSDGSSSQMSCDPAGRWGEKASSPPSASSTPLNHPSSQTGVLLITCTLQVGKLRPREVKQLSQGLTANKWYSPGLNPHISVSRTTFLTSFQKFPSKTTNL